MHYMYLRFIQFLYLENIEFCKIYIFFVDSFCKDLRAMSFQYIYLSYLFLVKGDDCCYLYNKNKIISQIVT
jgi:hypothetical protein